jgi:diguanylate cyclase (GGDEF)-like protein/PAS domain S-box-containing protein
MKRPDRADEDLVMKRSPARRALRLRGSHLSEAPASPDPDGDEASHPEPPVPTGPDVNELIAAAGGDFVGALSAACAAVVEIADVPRATVRLLEGAELRAWAASDENVAPVVPVAGSVDGLAVRDGQLVLCDDAAADDRVDPETSRRTGTRSWLVLPLTFDDVVVGTLSVSAPAPDAFGDPQRAREIADTLRDVADALGTHLQTAAWLLERHAAREETEGQINETYITAEMMTEGVIVFGPDGRFRRANNAACRLLGINLEQIAGRHVRDALRTLVHEDGSEWPGDEQPPAKTLATGAGFRDVIMGVNRAQGVPRWVSVSSRILPDAHGAPNGVVVVITDCTERRGLREQLDHATLHDEVTGLPNKSLLHLELDDMLDRSRRQGLGTALVHVVLADLAGIRSRAGAHGGDDVLRTVGERLQQTVRDGEMVARTGDDEFGIVLGLLGDTPRAVEALLARVRACLAEPVTARRETVTPGVEFVVSAFPEVGHTAEALLRHAALDRMNGRAIAA